MAEKKELCFAFILGLLAGPVYLLTGPASFIQWYCVIVFSCIFLTAFWLKNLMMTFKFWLMWPALMALGIVISLSVVKIIKGVI